MRLKKMIYPALFVLLLVISVIYKLAFDSRKEELIILETSVSTIESDISESLSSETLLSIYVYMCGAVMTPGVYEVTSGTMVNDVLILAGGFSEDADMERVDLVRYIYENETIRIPRVGEITQDENGEVNVGLININEATVQELMTLPGIGNTTANSIVEYRSESSFTCIEDIMLVSGIGEAKFQKIKDLICVS